MPTPKPTGKHSSLWPLATQEHAGHSSTGGQTASSLDTVKGHVLTIRKQKPKTLFLVEGDQNVPYGKVVVLMSELQQAGVTNLGLVTEPPGRS